MGEEMQRLKFKFYINTRLFLQLGNIALNSGDVFVCEAAWCQIGIELKMLERSF